METKTYTTIDRTAAGWPSGPWDGEPDKVQWPDAATGLPCLAVRHQFFGHWCGYVGVRDGHPWYGVNYQLIQPQPGVHGGLTFSAACRPEDHEAEGVCHVPGPGEPEHVWWLGFDCRHAEDMSPRTFLLGIYRRLDYVQAECASLAQQAAEAAA